MSELFPNIFKNQVPKTKGKVKRQKEKMSEGKRDLQGRLSKFAIDVVKFLRTLPNRREYDVFTQ